MPNLPLISFNGPSVMNPQQKKPGLLAGMGPQTPQTFTGSTANQPWYASGSRALTGDAITDSLNSAHDAAFQAYGTEEARGQQTEDFLRNELDAASKPTYTDEDIARMFTSQSDAAARTQLDQESGLRANLGASGITGGGYAAGLLTGFENQRQAAVTDARRSLAITKATADANDRLNRFKNAQVLATQMGRAPAMEMSDFYNNAAGVTLARYGVDKQAAAAKKTASNNLLGGIIGGGLQLLGGIL